MNEINIGQPLGLNSKLPLARMEASTEGGAASWLRVAENIDLHSDGYIQRRGGFTQSQTGAWRDLWADDLGAYAIVDGQFCAIDKTTLTQIPVAGVIAQGKMSYCRLPDNLVYASDGYSLWVLDGASSSLLSAFNPDEEGQAAMPAGSCLAHYRGQLLVASGTFLYISEPFQYNTRKLHRGFIPFPAPITVIAPCEDGVFICADKTYWLGGDLLEGAPVVVSLLSALKNSLVLDNERAVAYWQSQKGLVIGTAGGQIKFPQDEALDFEPAKAGVTWLRERDGQKYVIAARQKEE